MTCNEIYQQTYDAAKELFLENRAHFNPVRLMVVGGSSSEIAGGTIGHDSTYEYGEATAEAAIAAGKEFGFELAFQCCEHLNRALVMERRVAEARGWEIVCAVPRKKAGGSLATAAWKRLEDPVLVEHIAADAGLDIGRTMIGMHLRSVAVPIRLKNDHVGKALLIAARTRPKLVGGERACYTEEEN